MSANPLDGEWRNAWHKRHFGSSEQHGRSFDPGALARSVVFARGDKAHGFSKKFRSWATKQGTASDCLKDFLATGCPKFVDNRKTGHQLRRTVNRRTVPDLNVNISLSPPSDELHSASRIVDFSFRFEGSNSDSENDAADEYSSHEYSLTSADKEQRRSLPNSPRIPVADGLASSTLSALKSTGDADAAGRIDTAASPRIDSRLEPALLSLDAADPDRHCGNGGGRSPASNNAPHPRDTADSAAATTAAARLTAPHQAGASPAAAAAAIAVSAEGLQPACDSEDDVDACVALYCEHALAVRG